MFILKEEKFGWYFKPKRWNHSLFSGLIEKYDVHIKTEKLYQKCQKLVSIYLPQLLNLLLFADIVTVWLFSIFFFLPKLMPLFFWLILSSTPSPHCIPSFAFVFPWYILVWQNLGIQSSAWFLHFLGASCRYLGTVTVESWNFKNAKEDVIFRNSLENKKLFSRIVVNVLFHALYSDNKYILSNLSIYFHFHSSS